MSTKTVVLAISASLCLSAVLVTLLLLSQGSGEERMALERRLGGLADRLGMIEERLEDLRARIDRAGDEASGNGVEERGSGGAAGPAAEEEGGEGGRERPRDLASIQEQLEVMRLRLQALEEDPIRRGFAFLGSGSEWLRREGIRSLRRLGQFDPEARAAIRQMLADPSAPVRLEALAALRELKDKESIPAMAGLLADGEPRVRRESIQALRDLGARESAGAIAQLLLNDRDEGIREEAADSLGPLKAPEAADALIAALQDPSDRVRGQAIASLGEMGARAAAPQLKAMYDSNPGAQHMRLVNALRALGDPRPFQNEVGVLSRRAVSDPDEGARLHAVQDLSIYARESSRAVFQQALQDSSPAVRREAERALASLREKREGREGRERREGQPEGRPR